jgi:hypothetical protein
MDVAELRKRLLRELERPAAGADRKAAAEATRHGYERLLTATIGPLLKQAANILKAEGWLCDVHTPSESARLAFASSPETYIEFYLDTTPPAHVIGRSSVRRKGGIEVQERIVGAGRAVEDLTEEDVLAYLLPELSLILR